MLDTVLEDKKTVVEILNRVDDTFGLEEEETIERIVFWQSY